MHPVSGERVGNQHYISKCMELVAQLALPTVGRDPHLNKPWDRSAARLESLLNETLLEGLANEQFSWQAKGLPLDGRYRSPGEVRRARPSLTSGSFSTPLAVLRDQAIAHNIELMARYCINHRVALAPHVKTTMAPALFRRQELAGAWGVTVATTWQARVWREFGVSRILIANQIADAAGVSWIQAEVEADPRSSILSFVDSAEQVRVVRSHLDRGPSGMPLDVLVEVGTAGGRTGCRTESEVRETIEAVSRSPYHRLIGVAGYEGLLGDDPSEATLGKVQEFVSRLRTAAEMVAQSGWLDTESMIVTAGGSAFFDVVVDGFSDVLVADAAPSVELVLRSGSYIVHDIGLYRDVSPFARRSDLGDTSFMQAAELWGTVISRPEPTLALIDVGRRDGPFDVTPPTPLRHLRNGAWMNAPTSWRIRDANDQHSYLEVRRAHQLSIGDKISFGITHPCTFFDKWQWIPVIDGEDRVVDVIRTYF